MTPPKNDIFYDQDFHGRRRFENRFSTSQNFIASLPCACDAFES
jgi:hypothetical protein